MQWDKLLYDDDMLPHIEDSLRNGDFEIMPVFIRLVDTIINLDTVTRMADHERDGRRCITVYFDADNYERFYDSNTDPSYSQLRRFIEAQQVLTIQE